MTTSVAKSETSAKEVNATGAFKNRSESRAIKRPYPETWIDGYTEEHKESVIRIIDWMNKNLKSDGYMGAACGISHATVNLIVRGKYTGQLQKNINLLLNVLERAGQQNAESMYTPFVETSVSRHIETACEVARASASISIVACSVGTGKTRALNEYMKSHPQTWMVESYPGMTKGCLLDMVMEAINIPQNSQQRSQTQKFRRILAAIKDIEGGLLILDEAETVRTQSLEVLRRLRDLGGIGLMLTGTPNLYSLIKPEGSEFDQIRSRTHCFPEPIYKITRDDARAILCVSFSDFPEVYDEDGAVNSELFETFWSLCDGSMRLLAEILIPAVYRFGIKQHGTVNSNIVLAVAKTVLSLKPKNQKGK